MAAAAMLDVVEDSDGDEANTSRRRLRPIRTEVRTALQPEASKVAGDEE